MNSTTAGINGTTASVNNAVVEAHDEITGANDVIGRINSLLGVNGSARILSAPTAADGLPAGSKAEHRSLRELCHDLMVPAAAIRFLVEAAGRESDPDSATLLRLGQIADEASRIVDICAYFLGQPHDDAQVRLDAVVGDVVGSIQQRYTGAIETITDPVTVAVHRVVLIRILSNLLDNACRAAGPEGRVRVEARRAGGGARLAISDSGKGFGHGSAGTASLGLDIVGNLVARSGGSLHMGASDLGGLDVTVTLPGAVQPD